MQKEEYGIMYIYCVLGKCLWTERMKMNKCFSSVVRTTEVLFYISIVQGLKSRRVGK